MKLLLLNILHHSCSPFWREFVSHDCMSCILLLCVGKACIAMCIDNMQRTSDLSPIELVEMFVTVFCFLKDSSEVSQVLLDDFRAANGYIFLSEFVIKLVMVFVCF